MSVCSDGDPLMQAVLLKVEELQEELSRAEQSGDQPTPSADDPVVLAGFDHCFRETLDYLINHERLDFDHPLVRSLLLYLIHKRKGVVKEVATGDKENVNG